MTLNNVRIVYPFPYPLPFPYPYPSLPWPFRQDPRNQ
jgi:hypothetical protein